MVSDRVEEDVRTEMSSGSSVSEFWIWLIKSSVDTGSARTSVRTVEIGVVWKGAGCDNILELDIAPDRLVPTANLISSAGCRRVIR